MLKQIVFYPKDLVFKTVSVPVASFAFYFAKSFMDFVVAVAAAGKQDSVRTAASGARR